MIYVMSNVRPRWIMNACAMAGFLLPFGTPYKAHTGPQQRSCPLFLRIRDMLLILSAWCWGMKDAALEGSDG
jgi:hypothetical protein